MLRVAGPHRLEGGALFRAWSSRARDFDGPLASPSSPRESATRRSGGPFCRTPGACPAAAPPSPSAAGSIASRRRARSASAPGLRHLHLRPGHPASLAFGEHAQFPSFLQLHGEHGNAELRAERSRHLAAALERDLGGRTRLRLEAYDQDESGGLFTPAAEWRIAGGRIRAPDPAPPFDNALQGRSRGVEVMLQRRSANGLSGWLAYALRPRAGARRAPPVCASTPTSTSATPLTGYGSVRVSETLNLSAKFRYGSGFPIAGYFRHAADGGFALSDERNTVRAGVYSRLDLRANKTWIFRSWKLTVFGELLNALGHTNRRYSGFDLDRRTGRVFIESDTLFPRLPSLGVTADF